MNEKHYLTRRDHLKLAKQIEAVERRLREKQLSSGEIADTGGNQWHDNAGYDNLVIEIRGINEQLTKLHRVMNACSVVEIPSSADKVAIGTEVVITVSGEEQQWSIVGYDSSDIDNGLLAYNTPIARQILGARVGETRVIKIHGSPAQVKVLSIKISDGGQE